MKHKIKKVNHCLLCKNRKIKKIFSLGNLYVSNFVKKEQINKGVKSPLTLMYCPNCTLIQLSHISPQEILYKGFYWYKSGITKIMRDGLKDIYVSQESIIGKFLHKRINLDGTEDKFDIGTELVRFRNNCF